MKTFWRDLLWDVGSALLASGLLAFVLHVSRQPSSLLVFCGTVATAYFISGRVVRWYIGRKDPSA
jgi:hypothetical protein